MEKISKDKFIAEIDQTYAEWQARLAKITPEAMTQPVQPGGWSVKDVIAHITWHEREMIGVLRQRALRGSELWLRPTDERNAVIYEQNKDRSLSEILSEAARVHTELMPALATLSDDELNDPAHFAEMPAEWLPWDLIAGNTSRHYREHSADLDRWAAA